MTPIRTEDGALTPPSDPQQVGWWSDGARPGAAEGAAVVTGHTVHTGGGAFDDLDTLAPGDRVLVRSASDDLAYRVASVEVLSRDELARRSADVFGRTGPPRLVLITCEDWDGTELPQQRGGHGRAGRLIRGARGARRSRPGAPSHRPASRR